jgi:hypothetical protein
MLVLFDQSTPVTQEALAKKRRRGAGLQKEPIRIRLYGVRRLDAALFFVGSTATGCRQDSR